MVLPLSKWVLSLFLLADIFNADWRKFMTTAQQKVTEIEQELKSLGLLRKKAPAWVQEFPLDKTMTGEDFVDWLQFVYLPNCHNGNSVAEHGQIVLQAKKFWKEDWQKGQLLQLLVELDAII